MEKVWEAYWDGPGGTKEALERVVAVVLEHSAGGADKHDVPATGRPPVGAIPLFIDTEDRSSEAAS
jgi:hypothetical protein